MTRYKELRIFIREYVTVNIAHVTLQPSWCDNVDRTWNRVATKIFEGYGEALFKEFILGQKPVSIVHYTWPGSSIKLPTQN